MGAAIFKILLVQYFLFFCHCNSQTTIKKSEFETSRISLSDTLKVGYTYWWSQSGPFIGNCGDKYALVFTGVIKQMNDKVKDTTKLYISKNGLVEIENVLVNRKLKNNSYNKQKYFISDCFHDQGLKVGDRVIIFCYEYEGSYSMPGGKSILKIKKKNDPIVASIKKYIQSDQNPLSIKQDLHLWKKYDLDAELKQIIECKKLFEE